MTKFSQAIATTSPNNSKVADGGHIEFRKMLTSQYWMKVFTQHFVQRCNTTTQRTAVQKTEPEVNLHDVVSRTSLTKCGSFSAIVREIWTKFGTPLKKQTVVMAERPNSLIVKMRRGAVRHIEFRKMSIFPWQTTGNDCRTAFSLHVVESVSDEYNF